MHRVSQLPAKELADRLRLGRFQLRVGPYVYRLQSQLPQVIRGIEALYRDFPLAEPRSFTDYNIGIGHGGLAGRLRRKVEFRFEHQNPFPTIPIGQAFAFLEWGMNWCVSIHANEYLKLHAAAVARDGSAIIMPGVPGAGKSTLCAGLGLRGWRVLSDEHALVPPGTTSVIPLCRPVSLKNDSIALIKSFDSAAILGPTSEQTHKGTVAHMKADLTDDSHDISPIPARIMLFPKYARDEPQGLYPRSKTQSFILAAYHSFNFSLLGEVGFAAMRALIDGVSCYDLVYRDLDWAIQNVGELHDRDGRP